jgi:transcriptional regulator with XRE-family HTH domain
MLAEAITENRASIANWENDRSEPSANVIVALAEFYEVSTDFILGKNPEIVAEEGLFYGLDEEEQNAIRGQADFYRYRKKLPEDSGDGSRGYPSTGKNGKEPRMKKAR